MLSSQYLWLAPVNKHQTTGILMGKRIFSLVLQHFLVLLLFSADLFGTKSYLLTVQYLIQLFFSVLETLKLVITSSIFSIWYYHSHVISISDLKSKPFQLVCEMYVVKG